MNTNAYGKISNYLNERGINDNFYRTFLQKIDDDELDYKLCTIDGFDFMVDHFFDNSSELGYGLIETNKILKTAGSFYLAIGLIEGDDVICMNTLTGEITIWMIQNGGGEHIEVANSFAEFYDMCVE